MWQTIISCPVIFEEKLDIWKSDSMSNLAIFWEILKIRRRKFLKKSHEIRHFIYLFSPNLGGKSCKSLVRKRSPLDNALWRRNCCLNPQKQPLFWEKSNENLTTRHLQRARKLDKMSPIIGDAKLSESVTSCVRETVSEVAHQSSGEIENREGQII